MLWIERVDLRLEPATATGRHTKDNRGRPRKMVIASRKALVEH